MGNWKTLFLLTLVFATEGCVQKTAETDVLRNKLLCADKGREFAERRRHEEPLFGLSAEMFSYDPVRNTCLVYYETGTPNARHHNIVDLATNQDLYSFLDWFDESTKKIALENCRTKALKPSECLSWDQFKAKRAELFKQD